MEAPATRVTPCGTCRMCCKGQAIVVSRDLGDDVSSFVTVLGRHPLTGLPARLLPHRPDGSCHYLGPDGCTIWGRHPVVCKQYDCGEAYAALPRAEWRRRVKAGREDKALIDRGREIHQMRQRGEA